jgi:hypothetical protein
MATFKLTGGVSHFYEKLIGGMVARGYPKDFAERIFKQIEGFGSYGFPESHAASFAKIAYASCWEAAVSEHDIGWSQGLHAAYNRIVRQVRQNFRRHR